MTHFFNPATFSVATIKQHWFSNVRGDVLSGLVVALALISEAIAFQLLQALTPKLGCMRRFVSPW